MWATGFVFDAFHSGEICEMTILPPNKTLEPTRVDAFSSAIAVLVFWSRVAQLGRLATRTHDNSSHIYSD